MNRKSRSWFFTGVNCHLECFYLVQLCQISSLVGPTIASLLETGQMSQNWRMEARGSSSRGRRAPGAQHWLEAFLVGVLSISQKPDRSSSKRPEGARLRLLDSTQAILLLSMLCVAALLLSCVV